MNDTSKMSTATPWSSRSIATSNACLRSPLLHTDLIYCKLRSLVSRLSLDNIYGILPLINILRIPRVYYHQKILIAYSKILLGIHGISYLIL